MSEEDENRIESYPEKLGWDNDGTSEPNAIKSSAKLECEYWQSKLKELKDQMETNRIEHQRDLAKLKKRDELVCTKW
jgi:hypothetical protein